MEEKRQFNAMGTIHNVDRRTQLLRAILSVIGAIVIGLGLAFDWIYGTSPGFDWGQMLICGLGCIYLAIAISLNYLPAIFRKLSLSLISVAAILLSLEGLSQLVKYDFYSSAWTTTPIYYRQPTVPVGDVFFRRPGDVKWTGRVLSQRFECYPDEPQITVTYDKYGFRNPPDLSDWEIVVVGDSFTELGYLPHDHLFTSRIAQALQVRVKNLGVSYTGMFTHNYYLREYGIAEHTKDAVLVFFEGNDVRDTLEEYEQLQKWKTTRQRGHRRLSDARTSSLIMAMGQRMRSIVVSKPSANAVFINGEARTPVQIGYTPPGKHDLNTEEKHALNLALASWVEITATHDVRPWLVYMPCKLRVLHGNLEFLDRAERRIVEWSPTDLPEYIDRVCQRNGIGFINVTGTLVEETRHGNLTYNHVGDWHLNHRGSLLVGQAISDELMADAIKRHEKSTPLSPSPGSDIN